MENSVRRSHIPIHTLAKQLGIPDLTKEAVKRQVKEVQILGAGEKARALKRVFGSQLDILQEPNHDAAATSLFLPLLKEVFDRGSMMDQECKVIHAGEVVTMREKAVPMLNRSSFISQVLSNKEQVESGTISLGRVDLQRFRDADFSNMKNTQGVRPADTIINITARTIRDVLREYWLEKKMDYNSDFYEVGRYGGDELIVAFMGKAAQAEKEKVMELVVKKLSTKEGYYRIGDTQWVEVMPILLKKEPGAERGVEWIYFPTEEHGEKVMYREYLDKGLILNKEDFDREKKNTQ